jgi:hypothetical protein
MFAAELKTHSLGAEVDGATIDEDGPGIATPLDPDSIDFVLRKFSSVIYNLFSAMSFIIYYFHT